MRVNSTDFGIDVIENFDHDVDRIEFDTADGQPVDITTTFVNGDVLVTAAGNGGTILLEDAAVGWTGDVFDFI